MYSINYLFLIIIINVLNVFLAMLKTVEKYVGTRMCNEHNNPEFTVYPN